MMSFKPLRLLLLTMFIVACAYSSVDAAYKDVQICNYTDKTIKELYICRSGENWGENLLYSTPMSIGERRSVSCFMSDGSLNNFRIVFDDGPPIYWYKFDMNGVWRISIYKNANGDYQAPVN